MCPKPKIIYSRYIPGDVPEKEKPKREPRIKKNAWESMENQGDLSELERHRLKNMQRNQAFLAELGLV